MAISNVILRQCDEYLSKLGAIKLAQAADPALAKRYAERAALTGATYKPNPAFKGWFGRKAVDAAKLGVPPGTVAKK